ncbi:MAG TPA: hypothetical protein DCX54_09220 [Flavobacteriales bacterium]|nr:hypothetical protein [Flavobacteriales bacterium]
MIHKFQPRNLNLALASMKNILTVGIVLLMFNLPVAAQKKWYVSPVAGVVLSPVKDNPENASLLKPGFSFGALGGPIFKDKWRLSFGFSVNQRYSSYSFQEPSADLGFVGDLIGNLIGGLSLDGTIYTENNTEYWTVDFPVTADYLFKSGFFFTGGFFANTTTGLKSELKTTTDIPFLDVIDIKSLGLGLFERLLPKNGTESETSRSSEGFNKTYFGLIGGLGADAGKVQLKIQYQYGFNDIRTEEPASNVAKQQALSLHIAYLFFPTAGPKSPRLKPRYDLDLIK